MSPTAVMCCGKIILLIATTIQLTTAAPASSSKEYIDYLAFQEPLQVDDKRAPWAPSIPRSDMFSQKVWELISERNKGKRGKTSGQIVEVEEMSSEDFINLLKLLQMGGFTDESFGIGLKALHEAREKSAQQNEISKSRAALEEFRGKGEPAIYQVDGTDGSKQILEVYDDSMPKRSASPLYLGLGQHAANAAMSAFENILDESKNYKPERPSNPVRFLGKR